MIFTVENFAAIENQVAFDKIPEGENLREVYNMMKGAIDFYYDDESIQSGIDDFLKNLQLATQKKNTKDPEPIAPKNKPKVVVKNTRKAVVKKPKKALVKQAQKATKKASEKTDVSPPVKKNKTIIDAKEVYTITDEVKLIKRFASYLNKNKTAKQLGVFVRSMQRSFVERKVSSVSLHMDLLKQIQNKLLNVEKLVHLENPDELIKLNADECFLNAIEKAKNSEKQYETVRLLKRYISLLGKEPTKAQVSSLIAAIEKSDQKKQPFSTEVEKAKETLTQWKVGQVLKFTSVGLSGTSKQMETLGYCGCHLEKKKEGLNSISASNDLPEGAVFIDNDFGAQLILPEYLKIIFNGAEQGFQVMISGEPGSGKSTFLVATCKDLADIGNKIAYISLEQIRLNKETGQWNAISSFKKLLHRKNAASHKNIHYYGFIPEDLSMYNYVIIDSVNTAKLEADELKYLAMKYPDHNFIYVFQNTKGGIYKGSKEFEHDVDVVLHTYKNAEDVSMVQSTKNRNGELGEVPIVFV